MNRRVGRCVSWLAGGWVVWWVGSSSSSSCNRSVGVWVGVQQHQQQQQQVVEVVSNNNNILLILELIIIFVRPQVAATFTRCSERYVLPGSSSPWRGGRGGMGEIMCPRSVPR